MLRKSLRKASHRLFYLIVVVIILTLLGIIAALWLSDEVSKRKDEMAAWASQQIGYPVTIESAGLYWYGLIPQLRIDNAAIHSEQTNQPVVAVKHARLSLDIIATLKTTEPVLAKASIEHAEVKVSRDESGQFAIVGLDSNVSSATDTSLNDVLRHLSWLKHAELLAIDLNYTDKKKNELSGLYQINQARLSFNNKHWQLDADFVLPAQLGSQVTLSGSSELKDDYTLENWRLRLQTEDAALATLIHDFNVKGLNLTEGEASVVADISSQNQTLSAEITLALREAVLHSARTSEADVNDVLINWLQGRISYQQRQEQWQVTGDNLHMRVAGETWPVTSFSVQKNEQGGIEAKADYLRLSDLTSLALMLDETPIAWRQMKPAGDLTQFVLHYSPQNGLQTLQFEGQDIAMLPWQEYPGVNGLSLSFDWHDEVAAIKFNSQATTFYADAWLKEAVFLESLTGQISWTKQHANDWVFNANALQLWNSDLNLQLNGQITHQQAATKTNLDLQLRDVVANRWQAYAPEQFIPEDFKQWAADAFVDGVITSGTISMHGDPAAFPFDEAPEQGSFNMQLQVENVQLHYADGWPDLMQVNGVIEGQGNNLDIKATAGNIAGFAFNGVTTTIENLVDGDPLLHADGLLTGTTAGALSFLDNSPLASRFGKLQKWLKVTGKSDIKLDLTVPLAHASDTQVQGHVTFADSQLTTPIISGLKADAINGQLNFSNSGVNGKNIRANIFSKPVTINAGTENNQTRIDVAGLIEVSELAKIWPDYVPPFISGTTPYTTEIAIIEPEEGEFNVQLAVNSELKGISIDAPSPLGKAADAVMPLELVISESNIKDELLYQLHLDNWLNAAVGVKAGMPRGQIVLGGEDAFLEGKKISVQGRLETFDVRPWLEWQQKQPALADTDVEMQGEVDLQFGEFLLPAGITLTDLALRVSKPQNLWTMNLISPQIRGQITVPSTLNDGGAISANLDYLKLTLAENKSTSADVAASLWPSMLINITQLEIDGMRLGQLDIKALRHGNSWQLQSASLKNPVLDASASGEWIKTAEHNKSQFEIHVATSDLKGLLGYYDFQQSIDARNAELSAQLNWPGSPLGFSRDNTQGTLDLNVGRGNLMNVEPGAAGRIFGLLSISALPRRLALDFSDLFGKGLDFSSIKGTFNLAGGVARTSDLTMRGDAALIEMTGSIDLFHKTYDQKVKITPRVSSALPLAGAVAGGPIGLGVGTAIMLVDKIAGQLFDREIVNLITYSYQLQGPWDNPEMHLAPSENQ